MATSNLLAIQQMQISALWPATDDELLSIIGANALPLVASPAVLLKEGRAGEFTYEGAEALGNVFEHPAFKKFAQLFFKNWGSQLADAICKNSKLAGELRQLTIEKRDIMVGLVVGAITSHIPDLAAYSGLMTALGIYIAKSGVQAFCETIHRANG